MNPRLLDAKAAAAYLGVSHWTIRAYVEKGDLTPVRLPAVRRGGGLPAAPVRRARSRCVRGSDEGSGVMSDHNFAQLRAFILDRSVSKTWEAARLEWGVAHVEMLEAPDQKCPCGYYPIRELCWLRNSKTGTEVFVGNVCVNRFMPELDSRLILDGLKRILDDCEHAANDALLRWALKHGVINRWEFEFGVDTRLKRRLSERQLQTRRSINSRIRERLQRNTRAAIQGRSGHLRVSREQWQRVLTLMESKR
jgi:hypothetical protein